MLRKDESNAEITAQILSEQNMSEFEQCVITSINGSTDVAAFLQERANYISYAVKDTHARYNDYIGQDFARRRVAKFADKGLDDVFEVLCDDNSIVMVKYYLYADRDISDVETIKQLNIPNNSQKSDRK